MIQEYFKTCMESWLDFLFNHLLQASTFLMGIGTIVHIFYPQYKDQIDVAIASMMAIKRG